MKIRIYNARILPMPEEKAGRRQVCYCSLVRFAKPVAVNEVNRNMSFYEIRRD